MCDTFIRQRISGTTSNLHQTSTTIDMYKVCDTFIANSLNNDLIVKGLWKSVNSRRSYR